MFLAAALCARELWNYHLLKRRKEDDTVGMRRERSSRIVCCVGVACILGADNSLILLSVRIYSHSFMYP